jgi:type IV pilus assembly protein PilY1
MERSYSLSALLAAMAALVSGSSLAAPSPYVEDFTGATTQNSWYYFNGACLTASKSAGTGTPGVTGGLGTPGQIPGCTSIFNSYYAAQGDASLVGGYNGTFPDPATNGALRFTNGKPGGYHENGAIVSATTFDASQGVQITFKTVTYLGDSGGAGKDGADGMSFYLIDATQPYTPGNGVWNGIGSWGGSLAYTCSNVNPPYTGLVSGYLGLGIDEYGNFLNGINVPAGWKGPAPTGDNTVLGFGYQPGRIGLRGAGSISWSYLNVYDSKHYPPTLTAAQQQAAVQNTCKTGTIWDYSKPASPKNTGTAIADYQPIPNAYSVLSAANPIANEAAKTRSSATPIVYNLRITADGLLSFKYSYNGGAYQQVINKQSITASNGALPGLLQFGFAGSTGGSTNIHEILCFKAIPVDTSASSAATDQTQTGRVQTSSQAYFAFYDSNDWTGRLTAYGLQVNSSGALSINTLANWDSECVLTGVAATGTCLTTGLAGPLARESPTTGNGGRVLMTWNGLSTAAAPGNGGIAFEGGSLTGTEVSALGDTAPNYYRLNYLRGARANEIPISGPTGTQIFRDRDGVLADIVDSSPVWVGPPSSPYAVNWGDRLFPNATMPENAVSQSYLNFQTSNQGRLNVVYVGANDGFLHGFRTGSEDINGNLISNSSTPNDGAEVLGYMPGAILNTIYNGLNSSLDFTSPQYAHNFYVDATPGTGDVYVNGAWHTWLVGGLGYGGAAIYALDITNPSSGNYTEANASAIVLGEWSSATIACANVANCGNNMGNTFGTPQIRRLHNGTWGAIFGNGFGSGSGDAGIYVMTVNDTAAACKGATYCFYYLSTGSTGNNGIAYVSPADLDGDHITDYVYAGDLQGHIWRFDLTSNQTSNWAVSAGPLFTTPGGQPITTQLALAAAPVSGALPSVIVAFGTGQRTEFTTTNSTSYAINGQSIYAVWDWNLTGWNSISTAQYASLTAANMLSLTGLSSPFTLGTANLQVQTFAVVNGAGGVDASNTPIVWAQCTAACTKGSFGWYVSLPNTNGATLVTSAAGVTPVTTAPMTEQIVSSPTLFQSALIVNSTIPANNSILSCTQSTDTGITYVISVTTGGTFASPGSSGSSTSFASAFVNYKDTQMVGLQTNETGTLSVLTTQQGSTNLLGQLIAPPTLGTGAPGGAQQIKLPPNTTTNRLTWVELR